MIPSDEIRERTKSFSLGFRNMSVIAIHYLDTTQYIMGMMELDVDLDSET